MVAGRDARRRLAVAFRAVVAVAATDSSNVQCSGSGDAICTACHIGYFGSGTSACTKCTLMENCEYGCGHEHGVSCDGPDGQHIQEECGDCKTGYFEPYCNACTVVDGCLADEMTCTTAGDTKCAKCAPGYFASDAVGEMDVCTACAPIKHCTKSFCTGTDDAICLECAFGWYPAGSLCSPVVFDEDRSLFCYEVGPTKAVPAVVKTHVVIDEEAAEEEEYEYAQDVCSKMTAEDISSSFQNEMKKATEDQAPLEALKKINLGYIETCNHNGCVTDSDDMGMGYEIFISCNMPRRRLSEDTLLKML
jgi:hypothetical protein